MSENGSPGRRAARGVQQLFGSFFGRSPPPEQAPPDYHRGGAENLFHDFFGGLQAAAAAVAGGDTSPADYGLNNAASHFQQQQQPSVVPPASTRVLQKLPKVKVLPDDLVEPSNRECVTCLESFKVGDTVTRLPCGHFFHPRCIVDWLERNCTCPVCRYELPTDDPSYECGRRERMRHRKPRFARHALERMSIADLKALATQRSVAVPHTILDKRELIDYLVDSGCVDLIYTAPVTVKYRRSELQAMSVKMLTHVMNEEAGVFFDKKDIIEKSDMIDIFCVSGRLEILPEIQDDGDEPVDDDDRKPAAQPQRPVNVETVYSSDSEDDEVIHDDGRTDPSLVMEENPSYCSPGATGNNKAGNTASKRRAAKTHNGSPIKDTNTKSGTATAATVSGRSTAAAVQSQPVAASVSNGSSASDDDDDDESPPPSQSVAAASSTEQLCDRVGNLSISDLQKMSSEYNLDLSDLVDEYQCLCRKVVERLATADKKNTSANNNGQSFVPASRNSTTEEYQEDVSPPQHRCSKRRRGNDSDYDYSSADLYYPNNLPSSSRAWSLQKRTVSELRTLAEEQNVDLSGCIERNEIVNRILASSPSEATAASSSEPNETAQQTDAVLSDSLFEGWSDSEIRALADVIGVDLSLPSSSSNNRQAMIEQIRAAAMDRPDARRYLHALAPLAALPIPELRAMARDWHVNVSDCLEKGDIIHRLVMAKLNQFV